MHDKIIITGLAIWIVVFSLLFVGAWFVILVIIAYTNSMS